LPEESPLKYVPLSLVFLTILFAGPLDALPRYAYRMLVSCQSCHVNPAGGGMRNIYGVTYGQETLPMKALREETGIDNFSTQLSEIIAVGADMRTRVIYRETDGNTSFIQTQGDLYVYARLNRLLGVYLDKGMNGGTEVFGIFRVLPAKGYLKVGRFTPAYGIRLEDRNNRAEDTGFEVGVAPGNFTASAGVFNGGGQNAGKVFAARSDVRVELAGVQASVGGSYLHRPSDAFDVRSFGVFGGVDYSGVTVFGEVDFRRDETEAGIRNGVGSFVEADVLVTPGVDIKFVYEYRDPDVDIKSGSFSLYTIGLEWFPVAGLEVRPLYLISTQEPDGGAGNELHLLFHFYL